VSVLLKLPVFLKFLLFTYECSANAVWYVSRLGCDYY
jgi:hypothetical protein